MWNNSNGGQTHEWLISMNTAQKTEVDSLINTTGLIDIYSPISSVVEKIFVKTGDIVEKNQVVAILNAMKMEFLIR